MGSEIEGVGLAMESGAMRNGTSVLWRVNSAATATGIEESNAKTPSGACTLKGASSRNTEVFPFAGTLIVAADPPFAANCTVAWLLLGFVTAIAVRYPLPVRNGNIPEETATVEGITVSLLTV